MQQAQAEVCWADSDNEDWISFDEQELNTGIANLYDEDSASDYNSEAEEEDDDAGIDNEMLVSLDNLEERSAPLSRPPYPSPGVAMAEENKPKRASLISKISSRFSHRRSDSRNSDLQKEREQEQRRDRGKGKKKKSKASQLSKRIRRLRETTERRARPNKKVVHRQRVNTNIISLDLGTLSNAAANVSTGDAFYCGNCGAVFCKHDKLLKSYDDVKLDDEDSSIWICRFCNCLNVVDIDEQELPTNETVDYMLAPPMVSDDQKQQQQQQSEQKQYIFCCDISGSMCVSQKIDTGNCNFKLKGNHLTQMSEDLAQFVDANARHLNHQSQEQYVSRLQCVQTAIDDQLSQLQKDSPNAKLGLVTFSNDVTVIGDGMSTHKVIAGGKLNEIEKLREIAQQCKIENSIQQAHEALSKALWNLQEEGQTALGPGLVVAIEMAATAAGSQVILCTDGLANVGVGKFDDQGDREEIMQWYQALGEYAMARGVVVNIISITDDGCRLEELGKVVEITNGSLKRINPLNLTDKFSGIIDNVSVATNCSAKMILHPGLKFDSTVENAQIKDDADDSNEKLAPVSEVSAADNDTYKTNIKFDDPQLQELNKDRKIYKAPCSTQDCGNVFEGSRIFFEYATNKEARKDFQGLQELPFQTQIEYQRPDGSRMLRVISQTKLITYDRKKVRNNLNFEILAKHGTHVTTELAAKGDYESSRAWTSANTHYMNMHANNQRQLFTLANYAQNNVALDHQMQQQIVKDSIQPQPQSFSMANTAEDLFMAPQAASIPAPPMSRSKRMAMRKNVRGDQFSSQIYNMKKKSKK